MDRGYPPPEPIWGTWPVLAPNFATELDEVQAPRPPYLEVPPWALVIARRGSRSLVLAGVQFYLLYLQDSDN